MGDPVRALAALEAEARDAIAAAADLPALQAARSALLGKKGSLSQVLRGLGGLAPEERGRVGQAANRLKGQVEGWLESRRAALENAARDRSLAEHQLDVIATDRRTLVTMDVDWQGLPGNGLGGLSSQLQMDRGFPPYIISRSANGHATILSVGVPAAGTKCFNATWESQLDLNQLGLPSGVGNAR